VPRPGCSSSNKIPTISEVIQVIREFLKPEENTTEHSRLFTATRYVTNGDEFHKGMKEKDKNKSKRRIAQEDTSDSSKGKNGAPDKKIIVLNLAEHMKMTVIENAGYSVTAEKCIIKHARTC